jgi:hypothetical protein
MTTGDKIADTAAAAAVITTAGVTLGDVQQVAQILAYIGSALAGIGAFVYYMVKISRKEK